MDETKKKAEVWAAEKGHTRLQRLPGQKPVIVTDWRFAAAQAHERWPAGQEITEADYDAAVARATSASLR